MFIFFEKVVLPLVLICLLAGKSYFAQSAAALPLISVQGNNFITSNDKTIVFRGLDTSDPDKLQRDKHWNKEYFQAMKSWGTNIVRFPVHPTAWRRQGPENYLKLLEQGVQWATELGLYVIIDWHSIGNLRSELYQNAMYETTK